MSRAPKQVIVVVADDDAELREMNEQLLSRAGYLTLGARDGREALARLRGISGPVIALTNLHMPRMDGWQLIAAMQASDELREIPVIVLSGLRAEGIDGVAVVLQKPVDPAQLLSAVREAARE